MGHHLVAFQTKDMMCCLATLWIPDSHGFKQHRSPSGMMTWSRIRYPPLKKRYQGLSFMENILIFTSVSIMVHQFERLNCWMVVHPFCSPFWWTFQMAKLLNEHAGSWFGTYFIFPDIGNGIIPTDKIIFFRGVGFSHQPETLMNRNSSSPDSSDIRNH